MDLNQLEEAKRVAGMLLLGCPRKTSLRLGIPEDLILCWAQSGTAVASGRVFPVLTKGKETIFILLGNPYMFAPNGRVFPLITRAASAVLVPDYSQSLCLVEPDDYYSFWETWADDIRG